LVAAAGLLPTLALAQAVTNPLGNVTICSLIQGVLKALMIIGVPISILLVVFVGFEFVMAQGKPEGLKKARSNFINTIIGIAIFFGASMVVGVVTNTLTQISGNGFSACQ